MTPAKEKVVIADCPSYEPAVLRRAVEECLAPFGGIQKIVRSGDRVLVKPNLIGIGSPESATTTHPQLVAEVLKMILDAGGKPVIGEDPAFGSAAMISRGCGLKKLTDALGVPTINFHEPRKVSNKIRKRSRYLILDREVVEADTIFNLAKLKVHCQLYLTAAVKNVFGCVTGKRKAAWHFQLGKDRIRFAEMLVETFYTVAPTFSIVDGVLGMERWGPRNGDPRHVGVLIGGVDGVALDRICAEIIGMKAADVPILRAAQNLDVGGYELDRIELFGKPIAAARVSDFKKVEQMIPVEFKIPRLIKSFVKNLFIRFFDVRPAEIAAD